MELTENQKMYAEIIQKAWEDADFKANLVANPVATIEEFTGRKLNLPAGKTFAVRDQTDENTVYINIPAKEEADAELSQEQLEAVAGGKNPFIIGNSAFNSNINKGFDISLSDRK